MDTLVAIKMQNFQSWANGTIQFAQGLNVIKGENSGGKSAVFNALMMACNPNKFTAKEKREFIRYGKEYAQAVFIFSGFQAGIVRILRNKVIYLYTEDMRTKKYDTLIGTPPRRLLELLEVYVEPRTGFLLNVVDSDRPLLLVNSDQKADSSLISSLIQSQELRRLIELFENKLPELESQKIKLLESQYRLEGRLTDLSYTDLATVESELNSAELLMDIFPVLIRIYDYVNGINIVDVDLNNLNKALEHIDFLERIENTGIFNLDEVAVSYDSDLLNICNLGIALEETGIQFIDTDLNNENLSEQETLLETINSFVELYNRLNAIDILQDNTRQLKTNVKDAYSNLDILEKFVDINNIINSAQVCIDIIDSTSIDIDRLDSILTTLVSENEVLNCPIYNSIVYKDKTCIPVNK